MLYKEIMLFIPRSLILSFLSKFTKVFDGFYEKVGGLDWISYQIGRCVGHKNNV